MDIRRTNRVLALAAMVQVVLLVQQLARKGHADGEEVDAFLMSLLAKDLEDAASVYGSAQKLRPGLTRLVSLLRGQKIEQSREILTYLGRMMTLERLLSRRPVMLHRIFLGMQAVERQVMHFPVSHANVVANLAEIYGETVSRLSPRIIVRGHSLHLRHTADTVRALLLAGIRAAHLWRQNRGSRLALLFSRSALLQEAERILKS